MNNVDKIFELIMNTDESLGGSCWEELHYSYLDTPKDIVDDVIETYMYNEIYDMKDITETEKKLALAKYFQHVANELNKEAMGVQELFDNTFDKFINK